MKTGHTEESGYGLIGSAVRDGRRLIVVVNGLKSTKERAAEAQKLLDFGFRQFRSYELFGANETVGDARVWGGDIVLGRSSSPANRCGCCCRTRKSTPRVPRLVYRGPLIAPVSEGQEVGFMRLTIDGKVISRVPLITGNNVAAEPSTCGARPWTA